METGNNRHRSSRIIHKINIIYNWCTRSKLQKKNYIISILVRASTFYHAACMHAPHCDSLSQICLLFTLSRLKQRPSTVCVCARALVWLRVRAHGAWAEEAVLAALPEPGHDPRCSQASRAPADPAKTLGLEQTLPPPASTINTSVFLLVIYIAAANASWDK